MFKKTSIICFLLAGSVIVRFSAAQSSVDLTSIMPRQDILRVKRGAVGERFWQLDAGTVPANGILIEGDVGVGIKDPGMYANVGSEGYNNITIGTEADDRHGNLNLVGKNRELDGAKGIGNISWFHDAEGTYHYNAGIHARLDGANDSAYFQFLTSSGDGSSPSERMRITSDGNIGIGTNDPKAKLDIGGSIYVEGGSGDINQDGKIDATDISAVSNHIWGISELSREEYARADVTGTGLVTVEDSNIITNMNLGYEREEAIRRVYTAAYRDTFGEGKLGFRVPEGYLILGKTSEPEAELHVNGSARIKRRLSVGSETEASGKYSVAMGNKTQATGDYSTAMGRFSQATGSYISTAIGYESLATADKSTAIGKGPIASGENSLAMGVITKATGYGSTAIGYLTEAAGSRATAMGWVTEARGDNSTAMGYKARAVGENSFAVNLSVEEGKNVGDNEFYIDNASFIGGNRAWNNDSDIRLKKEITPLENSLEKITQINGFKFEWKDGHKEYNDRRQIGLSAQEVENTFPEVVIHDEINDRYSMEYTGLIPVLVESIKAQQEIIESQRNDMSDFEEKISIMMEEISQLKSKIK